MAEPNDPRFSRVIEILHRMAQGSFSFRVELDDEKDEFNAILIAVNILAEELGASPTHSNFAPNAKESDFPHPILLSLDKNGTITDFSECACFDLKLDEDHLRGKRIRELLSTDSKEKWDKMKEELDSDTMQRETVITLEFLYNNDLLISKKFSVVRLVDNQSIFLIAPGSMTFVRELWRKSRNANNDEFKLRNKYNYEDLKKTRKARDYVYEHITEELPTLKFLAKHVGMNKRKLSLCFKKIYCISIKAYAYNQRLRMAKALLKASNIPIKVIALDVGFKSSHHFHRLFKAKYGITPAVFREASQKL